MQTLPKRAGPQIHMDPNVEAGLLRIRAKPILGALLCLLLLCTHEALAAKVVQNSSVESTAIRLTLQTSKTRYRVAEPIEMTAYLQNITQNKTYYVGSDLGNLLSIESFHYIELQVVDQKGKAVPLNRGAGTSIWKAGTTVQEKVAQEYIQLRPAMIVGLKDKVEIELQPGQYRLKAIYHEPEASQWSASEHDSLPIPVWTQKLVSNTVTITVVP